MSTSTITRSCPEQISHNDSGIIHVPNFFEGLKTPVMCGMVDVPILCDGNLLDGDGTNAWCVKCGQAVCSACIEAANLEMTLRDRW